MGPQLIGRVSDLDLTWDKELASSSTRLSPYIDLDIEHKNALRAVNAFNFVQMKRKFEKICFLLKIFQFMLLGFLVVINPYPNGYLRLH